MIRDRSANPLARALLALSVTLVALTLLTGAEPASAAGPSGAWWQLSSSSTPTYLAPNGEGTIVVTATNLGNTNVKADSGHPVTITDVVPPGMKVTGITPVACGIGAPEGPICAKKWPALNTVVKFPDCKTTGTTASCTFTETLAPYELWEMDLTVKLDPTAAIGKGEVNKVEVSGAGVPEKSLSRGLTVSNQQTPFGVEGYEVLPENELGEPEAQAGAHPYQLTTNVAFNRIYYEFANGRTTPSAPELIKNVHVNLPPGLIGNTLALPQCTELQFTTVRKNNLANLCPPDTAIGASLASLNEPLSAGAQTVSVPVFNLVPPEGEPARFGFIAFGVPVTLDTVVREGDYHVVVNVNNLSQEPALFGSQVTIWGVPGDSRHDVSRGTACLARGADAVEGETCEPPTKANTAPFLTLPTSCNEALQSSVSVQSWLRGSTFLPAFAATGTETPHGCDKLPFEPQMTVTPTQQTTNTPTGLEVLLKVPQDTTLEEKGLAESAVRDTVVKLPAGLQLSPSAADGLASCSEAQIGYPGGPSGGVNPTTGSYEFTSDDATCPAASKVGTVKIKTPVLKQVLEGSVYLAAQNENPAGSLFGIYIVVSDRETGVLVKLFGKVTLDGSTGQITSQFLNAPQLPFSELTLNLDDGPRASIATPRACGSYTTLASLAPWSGTAQVNQEPAFGLTSGPHGTPCASPQSFNPGVVAGATNSQAGAFTGFSLTMTRPDTDQQVKSLSVTLPPGLAGIVKNVGQCAEAQANAGTCGPESLIGHATASSGLGSDPFTITGGRVYLTEKYKGAPFGLSIVIPAKAGPFDFGNVITRSTINVDRNTAAITINTPEVPTMVNTERYGSIGVPVQLRRIDVVVDRPEFQFNPTNCSPLSITGAIGGDQGASTPIKTPFQVTNCNKLAFAPTLTAETSSNVTKTNGTSLVVKVTSGPGQANIGKTKIVFPEQLPSRLTTIQKACPDSVFEANPATCPEGSVIGTATAHTPVLAGPLTGPAYLVSHGGAAFPDAEFVLQGEGITLVLDGKTDIKKGITSSEFNSVPDAPVSTFVVTLPAGPHSAFTGHGDLCKPVKTVSKKVLVAKRVKRGKKTRTIKVRKTVTVNVADPLKLPTILTGQNGNVIEKSTPLAVTGCKAVKTFKATKHKAKKKKKKKSKKKTAKKK